MMELCHKKIGTEREREREREREGHTHIHGFRLRVARRDTRTNLSEALVCSNKIIIKII